MVQYSPFFRRENLPKWFGTPLSWKGMKFLKLTISLWPTPEFHLSRIDNANWACLKINSPITSTCTSTSFSISCVWKKDHHNLFSDAAWFVSGYLKLGSKNNPQWLKLNMLWIITLLQEETELMKREIEDLKTNAKVFQLSKCTACTFTLDL